MKNKRGNITVIALIIVIVAITTAIITWLVATKTQAPVQQAVVTQPTTPVAKTQPVAPATQETTQSAQIEGTSDWKIYTNTAYGFEIRYPSSYSIFQGVDQKTEKTIPADLNSKKIIITDNPRMFFSGEPVYLSVEVLDSYITNLEKWVSDNKIITDENSYRVIKKGSVSFAGEQAYQIQAECGIDSSGNIVLVNHDSKTYKIRYDSQNCLPLSEKILSTFKFTK
jgi:hypothetical protein